MTKLRDLFLCSFLFILGILIWIYKIIISSDVPINISLKEFIIILICILLYYVFQYYYLNMVSSRLISFANLTLLSILLILWIGNFTSSFICKCNKYNIIIDFIGCISIIIIILKSIIYIKHID